MKNSRIALPKKPFTRPVIVLFSLMTLAGLAGCGGSGGDGPVVKPGLTINSPSVTEGDTDTTELVFTITLSEDAASALTVDYSTADGTATETDGDFTAVNGQLMIAAGSRTASVSVFVNGDTVFEQNESFNLEISNPQGLELSENSITGIGTIDNDENADPKGYFTGTGTFNGVDYTDLTALAYSNRVLLFSPTANVIYDIVIMPTLLDYNGGAVEVYVDGSNEQAGAVTVSGTTNELQIQGTFAGGTGFGAGSFDVAFDVGNNKGATTVRISTGSFTPKSGVVVMAIDGMSTNNFETFNSDTSYSLSSQKLDPLLICSHVGTMSIPNPAVNIYSLQETISDFLNCDASLFATNYTGFAAVIDGVGTDDTILYAVTNSTRSVSAILAP